MGLQCNSMESVVGACLAPPPIPCLILILFSAFYLLRYPGVTTATMQSVVPELADVDPRILARIDIDGEHS